MLSIAILKNSAAASSYYAESDNYYAQDRSPSEWQGTGAERLGLNGEVDAATFTQLLDGQMPDGQQIHNAADGRRAGIDLTFSAPKSVSMQALIAGDKRLLDAHDKAVARTLEYAESLASYRVTEDYQTRIEKSENLVVANFRHDLNRSSDPNLHTHAVVINTTQRPDGQWRALEAGELLRQKMLMGAHYRAELALEVKQLGYEIRSTHHDGRFELAHITDKQVEAFSSRSQAIEAKLAKDGKTRETATSQEKQLATLTTRSAKTDVDRATLRENWLTKSHEQGINYAQQLEPRAVPILPESTRDAVNFAIAHNTERQAVVTEASLLRSALEQGTGTTNLAAIRAEINHQVKSGALIRANERYTTHAAQEREREILGVEAHGRGSVTPILSAAAAEQSLASSSLNPGQRAAATLVVTTDARISAIQGAAGTGKTTMLNEAKALAESQGYRVIGLAPSAAAARELGNSGIDSQTIASFNHREHSGLTSKTMVIVDEAGMVSAKDMQSVLQQIEIAGARAVLVGDVQQLKAVEAGKPFAQLQEAGIAKVEMSEIQRQHDKELRHAVELASQGHIEHSLKVLDRHIIEIDDSRSRYQAIAKDYTMLPKDERDKTIILAGTHAARAAINDNVRAELGLAGQGIMVTTLERKDLTAAQARMSVSYRPGDMVESQKAYASLGLARGDLSTVVETSTGRVTLERADGVQIEWRPALQTNMTAYHVAEQEIAVGDVLRLTANDHAAGIVNGDRATVNSIDAEHQKITFSKADGSMVTLDTSKPMHLDHGYCSTVHSAQGQTADRALIDADINSLTSHESSYYVAISRARNSVSIYTNDKSSLPEAMGRENIKHAALDVQRSHDTGLER